MDREEFVQRYANGQRDFTRVDLSGADFADSSGTWHYKDTTFNNTIMADGTIANE